MKILVIEDSVTTRRIIVNILNSAGFNDIIEARNGIEGMINMEGNDF